MLTIILLTLFAITASVKLPPNFKKCNRKSSDFKTCVFEAAQHGIKQMTHAYPELNIPTLSPFDLTELTISGGDGPVSLKQKFTDCKLYGINTLQLERFEFDFEKKEIWMSGEIPEVQKLCNYEIKGQILLLHINGRGHSNVTLKHLKVTDTIPFQEVIKKGKTYIKLTSSSVTMDPGLVIYDFVNSDDKRLSDAVNPVINDNWKEIFDDVKSSYSEMIDQIILSFGNSFFSKISVQEAFD